MKKTLIALAAVAATGAAFAQSAVTLYGVVDMGIAMQENTNTTGIAVLGPVSIERNRMMSVAAASRIGFRGNEDLGAGLRANFLVEWGFDPSEDPIALSNRQSFVGLSGAFGEVRLGRQVTPYHTVQGAVDFGGGLASPGYIPLLHNRARSSNAITYISPSFSGVTVTAQAGVGERDNVPADARNDNSFGLNAIYAAGPLTLAAAFDRVDYARTFSSVGGNAGAAIPLFGDNGAVPGMGGLSSRTSVWAVGGAYNFEVARVALAYSYLTDDKAVGNDVKSDGWNLGVQVPMGAITLFGNFGQADVTRAGVANSIDVTGFQLGATYALSRRTSAYVNYGSLELDVAGRGTLDRTQFAVGVRHNF